MNGNPLAKRLQIKGGQHLAVLNVPAGYVTALGQLPVGAELETQVTGEFD